jgi:hypothetical protein
MRRRGRFSRLRMRVGRALGGGLRVLVGREMVWFGSGLWFYLLNSSLPRHITTPEHLTNRRQRRKRETINPRTPPDAFIEKREMRVTDPPSGVLLTKLQPENLKIRRKRKRIDMLAVPRSSIAMLSLVDLDQVRSGSRSWCME